MEVSEAVACGLRVGIQTSQKIWGLEHLCGKTTELPVTPSLFLPLWCWRYVGVLNWFLRLPLWPGQSEQEPRRKPVSARRPIKTLTVTHSRAQTANQNSRSDAFWMEPGSDFSEQTHSRARAQSDCFVVAEMELGSESEEQEGKVEFSLLQSVI